MLNFGGFITRFIGIIYNPTYNWQGPHLAEQANEKTCSLPPVTSIGGPYKNNVLIDMVL